MDVSLENILSRDCSSFSRDDLESSSMRRRRPCCGCPGRSRVKAGAGGPGRGAEGGGRRPGGRRGGSDRSARGRGGRLRGRSAAIGAPRSSAAAAARTRWQELGLFRLLCPSLPAGGAGAARGSTSLRGRRRWTRGGARRGYGGEGGAKGAGGARERAGPAGKEGVAGAVHQALLALVSR
ncbi:uncharacterized protein LOC117698048 [Arvicanthis niloticus]|uniref:uncharacterized protein LOC117698048 n=1 Tax=Arvicanthis niloticus TaxID=61156 RepID=UPI00402BD764